MVSLGELSGSAGHRIASSDRPPALRNIDARPPAAHDQAGLIRAATCRQPPSMSAPIPVALLGFSPFDRKALASYFQMSGRGRPRYVQVLAMDSAELVIADADAAGVLELLKTLDRVKDVLFIGAAVPPDAVAWMMRPVDQVQVLRERICARDKAEGNQNFNGVFVNPAHHFIGNPSRH